MPTSLAIKSKFDSEFRRFSIPLNPDRPMSYAEFKNFVETVHSLHNIPFTLCYTSISGDLLPITNDENFRKSFESAFPCLRLLIQRKGESWEEKYGYGTGTLDRKKKGLSMLIPTASKPPRRNYNISNPEDFRQVSAIIDVDVVPETHRRVRLCKHGSDRPLGFYIRTGSAVRLTPQGAVKVDGIFISRLVEGGLAESTGLLGVNDEVIEVNGIDVQGKTIDQVTDMMVANASNLVVTTKPANQRNTLQRGSQQHDRPSEAFYRGGPGAPSAGYHATNGRSAHYGNNHHAGIHHQHHVSESESDDDAEIIDHMKSAKLR